MDEFVRLLGNQYSIYENFEQLESVFLRKHSGPHCVCGRGYTCGMVIATKNDDRDLT